MKHKKFKTPQIVIFKQPPKGYENAYPWKPNQSLLFLGEIANMPGHCVIVDRRGKVYWGYDTDNFRNPTEDEI